jgi:four helix bundle protein
VRKSEFGFRDLRVWQLGMELVEVVYRLTQQFPPQELYGLSSQMRRAAVSVPSNIAEGQVREHIREYLHHISMAQASLAELQTQIEIAGRPKYLQDAQVTECLASAESLTKQLYALRNGLVRKTQPVDP